MTLQADLEAAVATAQAASALFDAIVNGPATGPESLVAVGSGTVKTIARALAEIGDTSNQAIKDLSNVADVDFAGKAAAAVTPGDIGAATAGHDHDGVYEPADAAIARTDESRSWDEEAAQTRAGTLQVASLDALPEDTCTIVLGTSATIVADCDGTLVVPAEGYGDGRITIKNAGTGDRSLNLSGFGDAFNGGTLTGRNGKDDVVDYWVDDVDGVRKFRWVVLNEA